MTKQNSAVDRGATLITGGSGFIGTHLARRLIEQGKPVVSLDLKPPRVALPHVTYVIADVRSLSSTDLPKVNRIFNLAAIHTTPGHEDHEYYDTNVTGALEVVKFAELAEISEIVFTSSISVYGPSEERKDEKSIPAPVSAYGKSKLMAEHIHSAWQKSAKGRRLVTIRPAVVFGQGEGGNFARMASLLKKGFFVFPGRRDTIKSCIYVEDLLDLVQAAQAELGPDGSVILNGAYPECPTLEQIVTTLQSEFFPRARLLDVPSGVVIAAARFVGALKGVTGIHPDRVRKLLASTYVYPQWAVEMKLLPQGAFRAGVMRWATATNGSFI